MCFTKDGSDIIPDNFLGGIQKRVEKEALMKEKERGLVSQRKSGLAWTLEEFGKECLAEREGGGCAPTSTSFLF